jgi:hypothetical protein
MIAGGFLSRQFKPFRFDEEPTKISKERDFAVQSCFCSL